LALPHWLKALIVTIALIAGAPMAASAHGGHADEESVGIAVASASISEDQSAEAQGPKTSQAYFENADDAQKSRCASLCCCCQGMSQCGSSGGCSMGAALSNASAVMPDLRSTSAKGFESRVEMRVDPVFGFERPPRA
jgi:hypothetical protein